MPLATRRGNQSEGHVSGTRTHPADRGLRREVNLRPLSKDSAQDRPGTAEPALAANMVSIEPDTSPKVLRMLDLKGGHDNHYNKVTVHYLLLMQHALPSEWSKGNADTLTSQRSACIRGSQGCLPLRRP